jgi:hypothetical protein
VVTTVPVTSGNPAHRSAATALTVVLDIAAPIIVFYGLRWAGAGVFVALIAGAIAPTLSMLVKLTKDRRIDALAVAVLGVLLLSAGVSLIDGSPQFMAAKDCVLTAAWGGWFFLSLRGPRPLTFRFSRPLLEGRKVFDFRQRGWAPPSEESWDQVWQRSPRFRRIWTVTTVIWGVALLIDAAVRVAMAYTLPIDSIPGLSGALWIVTLLALQIITNIYFLHSGLWTVLLAETDQTSLT